MIHSPCALRKKIISRTTLRRKNRQLPCLGWMLGSKSLMWTMPIFHVLWARTEQNTSGELYVHINLHIHVCVDILLHIYIHIYSHTNPCVVFHSFRAIFYVHGFDEMMLARSAPKMVSSSFFLPDDGWRREGGKIFGEGNPDLGETLSWLGTSKLTFSKYHVIFCNKTVLIKTKSVGMTIFTVYSRDFIWLQLVSGSSITWLTFAKKRITGHMHNFPSICHDLPLCSPKILYALWSKLPLWRSSTL